MINFNAHRQSITLSHQPLYFSWNKFSLWCLLDRDWVEWVVHGKYDSGKFIKPPIIIIPTRHIYH